MIGRRSAAMLAIGLIGGALIVVLLILDLYVFVTFQRLKGRLQQKDVRAHERVASV